MIGWLSRSRRRQMAPGLKYAKICQVLLGVLLPFLARRRRFANCFVGANLGWPHSIGWPCHRRRRPNAPGLKYATIIALRQARRLHLGLLIGCRRNIHLCQKGRASGCNCCVDWRKIPTPGLGNWVSVRWQLQLGRDQLRPDETLPS